MIGPGRTCTKPDDRRVCACSTRAVLCAVLSFSLAIVPVSFDACLGGVKVDRSLSFAEEPTGSGTVDLAYKLGMTYTDLVESETSVLGGVTGYNVTSDEFATRSGQLAEDWNRFDLSVDLTDTEDQANFSVSYTSTSLIPRNFKPWTELTSAQQANYSTPANYVHSTWDDFGVKINVLEPDGNGGTQPVAVPEGESSPLQKLHNVFVAIRNGPVGIGDAAAAFIQNLGGSLGDLLFGDVEEQGNTSGLGATYRAVADLNGMAINFYAYPAVDTIGNNWCTTYLYEDILSSGRDYSYQRWLIADASIAPGSGASYNVMEYRISRSSNGAPLFSWGFGTNHPSSPVAREYKYSTKSWGYVTDAYSRNLTVSGRTKINGLNANFEGVYDFGDGIKYYDGAFHNDNTGGDVPGVTPDYGQMANTPVFISNNIVDADALIQRAQEEQEDSGDGNGRVIVIPAAIDVGGLETPEWPDFSDEIPSDEVPEVPDDEPVEPEQPENPWEPETEFQGDYGSLITALLAKPFTKLFPFCLIEDMRLLVVKLASAADGSESQELVIPLGDFGIAGMQNITLDLTALHDLGLMVRPWTTLLFVVALVAGTMAFFLKKGE